MMPRRVILRGIFGAVFLSVALFSNARPFDFSQNTSRPVELFEQSYGLSTQLNSFERTYYLLTLLTNSKGIVAHERYEQWCEEMRQSASDLNDGWSRIAEEKNAVVLLSNVNPDRAMLLLGQIEDPQPDLDGTYPEDVRSNGASIVFKNYWNSANDPSLRLKFLPAIEAEARRLGRTGEYAYLGMSFVVGQLAKSLTPGTQKDIDDIFNEALQFYKDEPYKFANRDRLFERFLEETKDKVSDRNLIEQAVRIFAEKALQSPKDMDFQAEVQNKKTNKTAWVTDDRVYLLFQAFPMIHQFAPQRTDELIQQYPDLKKASKDTKSDMVFLPAGYGPPAEQSAQAQLMHGKFLQASIIREIKNSLQRNDLQNAKVLAARLTDDASHIEGYTELLPALMSSAPEEAKRTYYGERTRLQEIRDRDEYLRAVVALAKASHEVQDPDSFSQLTSTALQQGTILFEEDSRQRPQWPLSERQGFKQLSDAVEFSASHGLESLHNQVLQLQNLELKANLLTFEAKAIANAQGQQH